MAHRDFTNPINTHIKIHLSKELNSTEPACKVRPTFTGFVVANDFNKVTCANCKKIVESIRRTLKN